MARTGLSVVLRNIQTMDATVYAALEAGRRASLLFGSAEVACMQPLALSAAGEAFSWGMCSGAAGECEAEPRRQGGLGGHASAIGKRLCMQVSAPV